MASKVPLRVIAEEAACSVGVVSAILNQGGKGVIRASDKTRERVIRAARKYGIKPGYSPHRIGLFFQRDESDVRVGYVEVMHTLVLQEALRAGLAVEYISDNQPDPRLDPSVDGIIGISHADRLARFGGIPFFPVVTINRPMLERGIHSVSSDHRQQGYLAASHGVSRGHTRIALLEAQPNCWGYDRHVEGYREALSEHGIPFDPALVGHTRETDLPDVLDAWVKAGVTLILNFHAQRSLETLHILTNVMGLRIGEDISTISDDGRPVFQFLNPPQTVIHQSLPRVAATAVSLMKDLVEKPDPRPTPERMDDIRFACKLIERDSVKDLRT
jgi:DNA-binding LacI/PurR family transcriptional regulator